MKTLIYFANVMSKKTINFLLDNKLITPPLSINKHHFLLLKGLSNQFQRIEVFALNKNKIKVSDDSEGNINFHYLNDYSFFDKIFLPFAIFFKFFPFLKIRPKVILDLLTLRVSLFGICISKLFLLKTTGIITDLPLFMTKNKLFIYFHYFLTLMVNSYILVNLNMLFSLKFKSNILIDTVVEKQVQKNIKKFDIFTFLYSGRVDKLNGIDNLCAAFDLLPFSHSKLIVIGDGPLLMELKNKYKRISFLGKIPNEQVIHLQKKSHVLLNTRLTNNSINLSSFPIKISEYLLSGSTVMSTPIQNLIGTDYEKHIIFFKGDTIQDIYEGLLSKNLNNLHENLEGRKFIYYKKNYLVQSKKIAFFLDHL
jgi:glycosyltransferase involved in cell wall biosynthesis